jgi:DNA-binding XRE family transcriptional regulator
MMTYTLPETKNLYGFGKKLSAYREAKEMSRLALANTIRVSPEHIWRLENGFRGCSRDLAIILGQVLSLEIDQINELLMLAGHRPMNKKGGLSENRLV